MMTTATYTALPAGGTTTVKSGKNHYGMTQREAKTRWVLNPGAEGAQVVVDLTTHHDPDSKVLRTSLTWGGVEPAVPGSVFHVETWASDHRLVGLGRTPVARYSKAALEAEHARVLAALADDEFFQMSGADMVFEQAAERNGLEA